MAMIVASNHLTEGTASSKDFRNRIESGLLIKPANCLRIWGCHPSGLGDLPDFSCISLLCTANGVMSNEFKFIPSNGHRGLGMLCNSSSVKTLLKNAFRLSALSFASVAFVPSCLVRDGILSLVFIFELTYDQEGFGLAFML